MTSTIQHAATLARDLAGRDLDPNVVAQAFTSLRVLLNRADDSTRSQRDAFTRWWRWLDTVTGSGADAVVRSRKTVSYFRTTRTVCKTHLDKLEPKDALSTLAWAIQLMRYYQSNPNAPTWFGDTPPATASTDTQTDTAPDRWEPEPEPPKPAAPTLPQVGEVFTGEILEDDGENVAIAVPHFTYKQALARVDNSVRGTRSYREGKTARVEVLRVRTLKSGLTILEVKPVQAEAQAAKKKKKGK
jgi:hypothetical protein